MLNDININTRARAGIRSKKGKDIMNGEGRVWDLHHVEFLELSVKPNLADFTMMIVIMMRETFVHLRISGII